MTNDGILWVLLGPMCFGTLAAQSPALSFDPGTHSVLASGLDATLLSALAKHPPEPQAMNLAFAVYFEESQLPILGDYNVENEGLRFTPRFPFMPGRTHRSVLDLAALFVLAGSPAPADATTLRLTFRIDPPPFNPKSRVTQVFPSANTVPANLLRIYIHFSHPMTRRGIAHYVHLLDATGQPVQDAFLEMDDGLWDPEGRRLTLFLHPGRIKRGLALNERLGPPLRPGFRYRLVVAKEAEDEDGLPLVEEFAKEFEVSDEDRISPDVHKWKVTTPRGGSLDPLIVTVDKSLDEALFARLLRVEDAAGRAIAGDSFVETKETSWRFIPRGVWRSGAYAVLVGAKLEDLAGNRPTRLFDELTAPDGRRAEARDVSVPFSVSR